MTFLRFRRHGEKWYAETPAGELAFGDRQGLYEWRDGRRIHYTGGDQTHVVDGQLTYGTPGGEPHRRGLAAYLQERPN